MVARWISLRRVLHGESKTKKQINKQWQYCFKIYSLQGGVEKGGLLKGGMKVVSPLYSFFLGGKGWYR